MVSRHEEPSGDSIEAQTVRLQQQLDELMKMVDGLDERIGHFATSPGERRTLESLKKRYSREALEMMMQLDLLEDPEDEECDEEWDDFEDEESV